MKLLFDRRYPVTRDVYKRQVQGIHPYTIEFQKQDDTFYLSSIQGFAPKSAHYQSKKDVYKRQSLSCAKNTYKK